MRLLSFDIETMAGKAYYFSTFKTNISIDQIITPPRLFCFSYQWEGEKKVHFVSEWQHGRDVMLSEMHRLLDEADAVLTYNGGRFDEPWVTGELMLDGWPQPSPFQHIDLYRLVSSKMRLPSKKLDYVAGRVLGEHKVAHSGFRLWRECDEGDPKALALMEKYAIQDTKLLLPIYHKLQGWFTSRHPNRAAIDGLENACVNCSSSNLQRRGYKYTSAGKYARYWCKDCGRWMRGRTSLASTEMRGI